MGGAANDGGGYVRPHRRWLNVLLVVAMLLTQLVIVSERVDATNHVTGLGDEVGTVENGGGSGFDFIDLETPEEQRVWNDVAPINEIQNISHDHSGGSFTLDYNGMGPTAAINWNDNAAAVEAALEGLGNITTVNVTENGTGDWDVEFVDPGQIDNPLLTVNTDSLTGGSALAIVEDTKGGGGTFTLTFGGETTSELAWDASATDVKNALEALAGVVSVSVVGNGDLGDEWKVTFVRGVPEMTSTPVSFPNGSTSISTFTQGMSAPIDSAGITYLGGSFLISDSEINEEPSVYDGVNMWEMDDTPSILDTGAFEETSKSSTEPTGLAYNPTDDRLYISDDNNDRIYSVDLVDGAFDVGDLLTSNEIHLESSGLGFEVDPEDVAWDPVSAQVWVASGVGGGTPLSPFFMSIAPGADGDFGGGDDVIGTPVDVSALIGDLEGIAYREVSDTLLLVDPTLKNPTGKEAIVEVTKDGRLIRTVEIAETDAPSDVTLAPASDGLGGTNMYIVDRGNDNNGPPTPPRDAKLWEYSTAFANLAPFVDAGLDQTVAFGDPANLVGDSYDDGQGSGYTTPPYVPSTTWTKVSGPGPVTFGDANALSTTATFDVPGVYELKLTSTDGDFSPEDTMFVSVSVDHLRFVPVEPCAVFDTRFGSGGLLGRHGGGDLLTFTVASDGALPSDQGGEACSPPPGDADAVMLNLVAVSPTGGGNLRVSEHGVVAAGGVVNFSPAEGTNSSAVPVEVDASGRIDVFINSGNESVTFVRGVVLGYYVDPDVDPSGLLFVPIDPCAVFDTRGGDAMDGGETRTFHVAGTFNPTTQGGAACTPPPSGAEAAMVNLVAIDPTKGGNLQAVASGGTPNGGVVNFAGLGSDNSNAVPIGLDGFGDMDVTVNNSGTDTVDVRGVVLGYYIPDTHPNAASGLGLVPMNSCAVFDTRSGTGIYQGRIDGGTTLPFTVASDSALPGAQGPGGCESPPSYAEAVMLNLVAIGPQDGGNLRASAQGTPANGGVVNFSPSRGTNSNAVPVAVDSNGKIDVYVNSGSNSVVDIRGVALAYYVAPN